MTNKAPITTTLHGKTVLAKLYDGKPYAKTFANTTQAERAAELTGGYVIRPFGSRPWYVCLDAA